ncbi:MAG: carboxypeptidase regulatory-like domain-containing protein [Terriglobales bacterium]
MIRSLKALVLVLILTLSLVASADTLTGTVRNATTGKASAGDEVVLLKLSQGMEEAARTTSDAQGRFTFEVTDAAAQHLVRVNHQDVNYHRPAPPGATSVEVEVYDVAAKVEGVKTVVNILRMETVAAGLEVVEVYGLRNESQPPRTWMTDRTLEVVLPAASEIQAAMVAGPGGMPVNASPVPQGQPGHYFFKFPIRPGETRFQITYRLPYSGEASFQPRLKYPVEHLVVMLPRTMQFTSSAQFQEMTEEDGSTVHVSTTVQPGKEPAFRVSGTGAFEPEAAAGAQPDNRPGGGLGPPSESPDPLAAYRWYILAGLGLALVVGAVYLMQKPGGARPTGAAPVDFAPSALAPSQAAGADKYGRAASSIADRRQLLLDALKDELFALETERLEGRVSQEEYQQAKTALDRALGRALKKVPST